MHIVLFVFQTFRHSNDLAQHKSHQSNKQQKKPCIYRQSFSVLRCLSTRHTLWKWWQCGPVDEHRLKLTLLIRTIPWRGVFIWIRSLTINNNTIVCIVHFAQCIVTADHIWGLVAQLSKSLIMRTLSLWATYQHNELCSTFLHIYGVRIRPNLFSLLYLW